jgi:DNA-directed RNA polymerase specialized sigma24 family protein
MLTTVGFSMNADHAQEMGDAAPDAFLSALQTAAQADDPETAAVATEAVTQALAPLLTRVAEVYAASWPTPVEAAELLHEAVVAVLAGLSLAPRQSRAAAVAWFSAEVFRALHAARDVAAGGVPGGRLLELEAPKDTRLRLVLGALAPREAAVLRLRSAGAPWAEVAGHLGVSVVTARRLHARALATARELSAPLRHVA